MLSGWQLILKCVHHVINLYRDQQVVILWLALVVKIFVTCVLNLGNQTIKTILNAIYITNETMIQQINKKQFWKR